MFGAEDFIGFPLMVEPEGTRYRNDIKKGVVYLITPAACTDEHGPRLSFFDEEDLTAFKKRLE